MDSEKAVNKEAHVLQRYIMKCQKTFDATKFEKEHRSKTIKTSKSSRPHETLRSFSNL